jgi:hypothetical protein
MRAAFYPGGRPECSTTRGTNFERRRRPKKNRAPL